MGNEFEEIEHKYQHLRKILKTMGRVLVAYSGGVDSTLLLKVAKDTLKEQVLAVTALSETTAKKERSDRLGCGVSRNLDSGRAPGDRTRRAVDGREEH